MAFEFGVIPYLGRAKQKCIMVINAIYKIDNALTCLSDTTDNFKKSLATISQYIGSDNNETSLVLEKPIKDGYAFKKEQKATSDIGWLTDGMYHITFEGSLFTQQGGYANAFLKNENQIKNDNRKANLLLYGTWLAGLAASAIVVIELLKHFVWAS